MPTLEPSNREFLKNIQAIPVKQILGAIQDLSRRVSENTIELAKNTDDLVKNTARLEENTFAITELKTELVDVQEMVGFIKDNAVMREEFKPELTTGLNSVKSDLRKEIKASVESLKVELGEEIQVVKRELREEIRETRNKVIQRMDDFIQEQKKQVGDHLALAGRLNRHEALPQHGRT